MSTKEFKDAVAERGFYGTLHTLASYCDTQAETCSPRSDAEFWIARANAIRKVDNTL